MISILAALDDPRLFGSALKDKATWAAWRAFLAALFGLPMSEAEAELYGACTGRAALPESAFAEAWLICGRRAGKSFVLALIAVYLAAFRDYRQYLGPGERCSVFVLAADRRQSRVILRYVKGLLAIPALAKLIEGETADSIDLENRVTIEVATASAKTTRGYTLAAALCDEIAFWPSEDSASPDVEVLAALRPAMATIPNAMLLCASSPYARRGAIWEAFRRYFGSADPDVLVWKAATRKMNPSVPKRIVDEAYQRDPASAAAEYGAEFRTDVEGFVSKEVIEACVEDGCFERAPLASIRYHGFVDPSGGSHDSFTLAIAHREGDTIVLDCLREIKPPFSPADATASLAATCKEYGLTKVTGDRYAGEWPREAFRTHGVDYEPADKTASEYYLSLLPLLNSRRVSLLDNTVARIQLESLERRQGRGGKDSVSHPANSHDDIANSLAGAIVSALGKSEPGILDFYRTSVAEMQGQEIVSPTVESPERGFVALKIPPGCGEAQGLSGRNYRPDSAGQIFVLPDDAPPFCRAGFLRIPEVIQ